MKISQQKTRALFFLSLYVCILGIVFFGVGKYTVVARHRDSEDDDRQFEQVVESIQAQGEPATAVVAEVLPSVIPSSPTELPVSTPSVLPTLTSTPEISASPIVVSPTAAPEISLTPSASPSGSPQPTPSVSPGIGGEQPTATPSATVSPKLTVTVTATPTPEITATPTLPPPTTTPVPTDTPIPTPTSEPAVLGTSTTEEPPTDEPKNVASLVSSMIKKVNMP